MTQNVTMKEMREYAWNYFELHARQRMAVFNYFVIIAALLTAGMAGSLGKNNSNHLISLALASSLTVASFVFWKLDQRVRYLIKHAENALKTLEKHWTNEDADINEHLALFSKEEANTAALRKQLRKKHHFLPLLWHLTYYECFSIVYVVFGSIGILGIIVSIIGFVK